MRRWVVSFRKHLKASRMRREGREYREFCWVLSMTLKPPVSGGKRHDGALNDNSHVSANILVTWLKYFSHMVKSFRRKVFFEKKSILEKVFLPRKVFYQMKKKSVK